jgi:hypothetical protein
VVTLLTPLEPELEPLLEVVAGVVVAAVVVAGVVAVVVAVVVAGVEATVVAADEVDALRANAGSWPETSMIVIISQVATNSATAPVITRWRILRARAARSARSACPRARPASLSSVIGRMGTASARAVSPT